MLNQGGLLLLALCIADLTTSGQVETQQTFPYDRPIVRQQKVKPTISYRPPQRRVQRQLASNRGESVYRPPKAPVLQEGITITVDGRPNGSSSGVKLDNMLSVLDKAIYSITKPANILSIVRFALLAFSSLLMSTIIFPLADISKSRASKYSGGDSGGWTSGRSTPTIDIDGIIEHVLRLYEERLRSRPTGNERSVCRLRSLCIIGDMMACDFPTVVMSASRLAQNHLPPLDSYKNKYTKAFLLGLNQTNCEQAFKTANYECPSILDHVRQYLQNNSKRRRDHHFRRHRH